MGGISEKIKYFAAYKSIKFIFEKCSHMTGIIDDVYLIDINTIPKYLEILNKRNILEYIQDLTKRSVVHKIEEELMDDFGDYELEKNIQLINIDNNYNYYNYRDENFILIDIDFLFYMGLHIGYHDYMKCKIIVNKYEIKIELPYSETYILIEETEKKGIYRFGGIREKSIDFSGDSSIGEKESEEEDFDPEVDLFREKPKNIEEESEKEDGKKVEENSGEDIKNTNNENEIIDIKSERAFVAKLDEIVKIIFFSIQNSNEQKEVIVENIHKKIRELKIDNILKEHDDLDIIKNIKTLIINLLESFSERNNVQNLDINSNYDHTFYHNDESQSLIFDQNDDEIPIPLMDENRENMKFQITDPFIYKQVEIYKCDNCGNFRNIDINSDYYKLNLNKACNNLEECFKMKYHKKCDKCNNNIEVIYRFKTAPEILIIVFDKPKDNIKYIQSISIEENIDLKNYLFNPNSLDNNKYTLIKSLYVFDDINDENLYVNIPQNKKNNYIPYIIFYKKIGDL